MTSAVILRAVANRLTSTSIDELPHQVGYLASSIASCKDVLQSQNLSSDQSIVIHKLKTRVSTLLQDRTSQGRFCGITIARALAQVGGSAALPETSGWIRSLISCLNKPDPWQVKYICLTTITHIYVLTVDDQAIVRNNTIPTLQAFITASLSIIKPPSSNQGGKIVRALSPLLSAVLRCWYILVKHFASTFRPHAASIKSICLSLISDGNCGRETQSAAEDVLSVLHFCAPKNTAMSEWSQSCSQVIEAAHDAADLVFRAIEEDWTPQMPRASKITRKQKLANIPATLAVDVFGLDRWTGVAEGCQRLASHIAMLEALIKNSHFQDVSLPIGAIFDLTSRLSAVTPPSSKFALRTNAEITRDEREEMWLNLPVIHTTLLKLFTTLVLSFGEALYPVCNEMMSQFWEIFESNWTNQDFRAAAYEFLGVSLTAHLVTCSRSLSSQFKTLVDICCADLTSPPRSVDMGSIALSNGDSNSKKSTSISTLALSETKNTTMATVGFASLNHILYSSACSLVPKLLTHAQLHLLTGGSSVRAQLDRISILLNLREAILASVLNPYQPSIDSKTKNLMQPNPSILPFLARSSTSENMTHLEDLSIDGLFRPRMPTISSSSETVHVQESRETDEELIIGDLTDATADESEKLGVGSFQPSAHHGSQSGIFNSSNQPTPDLASQGPVASQKRDFTALLEQSADEQLAASASASHPFGVSTVNGTASAEASKRPRIADKDDGKATENEYTSVAVDAEIEGPEAVRAMETYVPVEDNIGVSSLSTDKVTADVIGSSYTSGYESDHSSDSEIPLIDATLVGMSDSEGDEE